MVWRTFSCVAGRTSGLPCSTSDTVDFDTPAACATSMIVTRLRPPGSMLSLPSPVDLASAIFGTFQTNWATAAFEVAMTLSLILPAPDRSTEDYGLIGEPLAAAAPGLAFN